MPIQKLLAQTLFGDALALLAGITLTFAFAPFEIFPLAIMAPALLLTSWLNISPHRAFIRGFLFGLGLFTSGVYWIFISIHTFGNTSIALASLITGGLIALLALFPAYNGYLLNRFFPQTNRTKILCAFPAIWVLLEWVRSWIFTGFPWLFLGYSQMNSPLRGYAPIFSVYGVSLAVILSAALLLNCLLRMKRAQYKELYFSLIAITTIWIVGGLLSLINWTHPTGSATQISMVQGNIPQTVKWSPDQILPTLNHYQELTKPHWDSKIVIWPEAAIPLILQNAGGFLETMATLAKQHHSTLITGIPIEAPQAGSYYNAVVTVGDGEGIYSKQRLVPFGEYIPLTKVFKKFFDILHLPMSEFISAPRSLTPITIDGLKIATFICYEIAFPEQVRTRDGNTGMILTVSNDAWFGHSIAQAQHLQMGQMRALEMGRPVLFVSNDGITAFITDKGKIQSKAPQFESYVLTDSIHASVGKTPWQWIGMDPILLILVGLIVVAVRKQKTVKP